MKSFIVAVGFAIAFAAGRAAEVSTFEQQVAGAVATPQVTIVHLWAPWCPNCKAELANNGWSNFVQANPDVNIIFVTVWSGGQDDGRAMLAKNGIGGQPNVQVLFHPNASRKPGEKMTEFLGLPVTWIPSTWVFRAGTLCYALNYGELRFPMLQQLVRDAADKWEHPAANTKAP
jgi:thiol-disulfide isomerase/thioredoxin